jgi:hypothetical protein
LELANRATLCGGARTATGQQSSGWSKLIDIPGYVFRIFVTNRNDSVLEIWRDYNGRAAVECRIDELKNELAADRFCLRSFFATESAFLAVLFSFNLLSEFQRAIDPALKTYKQPATLPFRGLYLRCHPWP